jgi:hypothetical protein
MTEVSRERLEERIGEASQVVGLLAEMAGVLDDRQVLNTLNLLGNLREGTMLPFAPKPKMGVHLAHRVRRVR